MTAPQTDGTASRILDLKMSLLRGETAFPIDLGRLGRLASDRLRVLTRSASSDRLAVLVLDMIASGRLGPGTRLPPERRISDAAALSRACVRSAFERLKTGGYIEAVQGSGTRVAGRGGRVGELIEAGRENHADLGNFVTFLDRCAVDRLIGSACEARLAEVAGAVAASRRPDAPFSADAEVERRIAVAQACGSPVYALVTGRLERGTRSLFARLRPVEPGDGRPWVDSMAALAEALRRRDAAAARAALQSDAALLREKLAGPRRRPEDPAADVLPGEFVVPDREHLRTRITREIAALIAIEGQDEGDRLPSERRLADLFGVSRASVREALADLKARGAVMAEERCGTRVGTHAAALPAGSDPGHLQAMSRLHAHLEIRAAGRAAVQGSERDLADLRTVLSEMKREHLNHRRRVDLDVRLHLTIARAAGNAVHLYVTEILRHFVPPYFDHALSEPTLRDGGRHDGAPAPHGHRHGHPGAGRGGRERRHERALPGLRLPVPGAGRRRRGRVTPRRVRRRPAGPGPRAPRRRPAPSR